MSCPTVGVLLPYCATELQCRSTTRSLCLLQRLRGRVDRAVWEDIACHAQQLVCCCLTAPLSCSVGVLLVRCVCCNDLGAGSTELCGKTLHVMPNSWCVAALLCH